MLEPTPLNVGGEKSTTLLTNFTLDVWPLTSPEPVPNHPFAPPLSYMSISYFLLSPDVSYQLITSQIQIYLDWYIPQISNISSTIFILGRWPCFLFYSENKSNQKRNYVSPIHIPPYQHLPTFPLLWMTWLYSKPRPEFFPTRVLCSSCFIEIAPKG